MRGFSCIGLHNPKSSVNVGGAMRAASCYGAAVRDYVHVHDVARANVLAVEGDYRGIVNIGTGVPTSTNQLAAMICGDGPAKYGPGVPGSVTFNTLDWGKASDKLGWHPSIDLKEGLATL